MVVAIVTYKRPSMLKKLLLVLDKIEFYELFDIIIIDNDSEQSALIPYKDISEISKNRMHYRNEPKKGLANVRNRAMKESFMLSDTMAFIDDDEIPDALWLINLIKCKEYYDASVVIGPVYVKMECESKHKFITEDFFKHITEHSSHILTEGGGSGNCLISKEVIDIIGDNPFNQLYNDTGGEDSDFFSKVYKAGIKVAWAHNAITTEIITKDRLTLSYILKRRIYQAAYAVVNTSTNKKFLQLIFALARMSLGITRIILSLGIFNKLISRGVTNLAHSLGSIYGLAIFFRVIKPKSGLYTKTTGE